jgi:hypothetical protein
MGLVCRLSWVLPVFGSALLLAKRYWRQGAGATSVRPAGRARGRPTTVVRILLAALATLIVAVLALVVLVPKGPDLPPGQPMIVDGQYVLADHGSLAPVSRQVYLQALEAGQLGFTSIAVVFYYWLLPRSG